MKHLRIILFFAFFYASNTFSQSLPDFSVSNTNHVSDYFCMFSFKESEAKKIGEDFLFTSRVFPQEIDTIITDTFYFSFNQKYVKFRIKKISVSRNGTEYTIVDSFPSSDTLKWRLTEM